MDVWMAYVNGGRRLVRAPPPALPDLLSRRSNAPSAGFAYHKSVDRKTLSE
jgi:hypothetical protein